MGQYIQEGLRNLFETVISVENSNSVLQVPYDEENHDGLNFLAGKKLTEINHMAELGTMLAHVDGSFLAALDALHFSIPVIPMLAVFTP